MSPDVERRLCLGAVAAVVLCGVVTGCVSTRHTERRWGASEGWLAEDTRRVISGAESRLAYLQGLQRRVAGIDPNTTDEDELEALHAWQVTRGDREIRRVQALLRYNRMLLDGSVVTLPNMPFSRRKRIDIASVALTHMFTSADWHKPKDAYFVHLPEDIAAEALAGTPRPKRPVNPNRKPVVGKDVTFTISNIHRLKDGRALVAASWLFAPQSSEGHIIILAQNDGKWVVWGQGHAQPPDTRTSISQRQCQNNGTELRVDASGLLGYL